MKGIDEIYSELCADFAARTGIEPGTDGDLAVRFYTVAAQLQALYYQAEWVGKQCFPQTARGEYLDRHAALRGLRRRAAERAAGTIRFSRGDGTGEVTVGAGTVCMTAGLTRFVTTRDAVMAPGVTQIDVPARAEEPGPGGNVPAGSILTMAVAPVGVSACTNPAAFTGGAGEEGDEALRGRILETFQRLPNGANAAFYEQGALSFPEVGGAVVLPRARGIGTVDVVVTSMAGVPDEALLETLGRWFDERREIAVDVQVRAPETTAVDVTVQLKAAEGKTFAQAAAAARAAVERWFNGSRLGKAVLRAELGALIFALPETANCVVSAPAADVTAARDVLPVLGELTVQEMA